MVKVLLFDFDGTIADSFENFLEIFDILTAKYKLSVIPRDELLKLRSESAINLIKKLKIPFYKIPFIALDMKKLQLKKMANIKTFQDLPDTLRRLKSQGFKLGILTSNAEENVKLFLKSNNLEIFDYLSSDSSIFGKDKVISKFLKKYNFEKENVIYIGDEIRDVEACQKAGIKIIAVTWGFNSKGGLVKANPDFLAETPADLLRLVKT